MGRARPSPERGGVSSIQDALGQFLDASGLRRRLADSRAFDAWSAALGPALAQHARPVQLREGELVVEVASAAHLHELKNFTGEGFRRAANERLVGHGRDGTIRRVQFKLKS